MNTKIYLQIVSGTLNGLITAGALFTTLFGQDMTLKIIAVMGLTGIIVNAVSAPLLTQSATVKEVAAMPGVERIAVGPAANPTLAAVATDPAQKKVCAAMSTTQETLKEIAKGA